MVEIPKAAVVERIRRRGGPEAADSANDELPDKLDLDSDSDARLLRRYNIEPDELREEVWRRFAVHGLEGRGTRRDYLLTRIGHRTLGAAERV
jgi:hypothetical protein